MPSRLPRTRLLRRVPLPALNVSFSAVLLGISHSSDYRVHTPSSFLLISISPSRYSEQRLSFSLGLLAILNVMSNNQAGWCTKQQPRAKKQNSSEQ